MLDGLVSKTVPLNPSFVFVGGDMQNWWPNEGAQKDRNRPGGMSDADFQELCSKDLGRKQRASVRRSLEALEGAGIQCTIRQAIMTLATTRMFKLLSDMWALVVRPDGGPCSSG